MATSEMANAPFPPRLHNDVYPFIYPCKYRGSLKDKVVIITGKQTRLTWKSSAVPLTFVEGAAGTLGQSLAHCFAVAAADLVLVYNRTKPPSSLEERCKTLGASSTLLVQCDVSVLENCQNLVKEVLVAKGKVDILVNNAGANDLCPMHTQDPEKFIQDLAVNLHGPYYLMRLLLPSFRSQRSGCVLNIASRAGTVIIPYSTSYCASKAALINLTGCVQAELDAEGLDGVHLYSLHPGGVVSEMTSKKYSDESLKHLPEKAARAFNGWLDMYVDSPYLNGMVCVALAAGVAKKALRGRYFDVGQDLEDVVTQSAALEADRDLYTLHTRFVGGLSNGNPVDRPKDEPFDFPGYDDV